MMNQRDPKMDAYFQKRKTWRDEFEALRAIALDCDLAETVKWRHPCYMYEGSNIVLIHDFKEYCALLFFKGALLQDADGILVQQTKNVQAARQIRFTNVQEILDIEATVKAYILEAIEVEKSGLTVEMKKTEEFEAPAEFQQRLDEDAELKAAFEALTPGRQRAYLLHFGSAKQAKTREARIEKSRPQILAGKGLNDR